MNNSTIIVFTIVTLSVLMYAATLFLITVDASPKWILPMVLVVGIVVAWLYVEVMG